MTLSTENDLLMDGWWWPNLLYAELQYVTHVGWQQGEKRVECPVVGEVSHDDGPQRSGCRYRSPGDVACWGGQLGETGNIEQVLINTRNTHWK